jgi:hypothetical protein
MNRYAIITVMLLTILASCEKKPSEQKPGSLMLTGIQITKGSEMVSINLDSGYVSTNPVNCYVLSSTVYDPNTGGYGYVNCDTVFNLINTETGDILKSFRLPGLISSAVIDPENDLLIGTYGEYEYIDDPDSSNNATIPVFHTYLLTTSLETGDIVLRKEIDLGDGVMICTHYYDPVNKLYVMQRADNRLIFFNTVTGTISRTADIGRPLVNVAYNPDDGTIISVGLEDEEGTYYIKVYEPETGKRLSLKEVAGVKGVYACMAAYDHETGCYLTVSTDNDVLFIDPATGEIKKTVKLDYTLSDVRFLRR